MSSVFRKDDQAVMKPKRNPYDKTFCKNLSVRFGELIPVFAQPVMNGETVFVKHKHNFNFMPLVFPVQTRVRASLEYFYVRNRNVWKDWEDFQFKMKPNLVPPYLKFNKAMQRDMLRVGGMLDNIGCPVTVSEDIGKAIPVEPLRWNPDLRRTWFNPYTSTYVDGFLHIDDAQYQSILGDRFGWIDFSDIDVSDTSADSMPFVKFRYPIRSYSESYREVPTLHIMSLLASEETSGLDVFLLCRASRITDTAEYRTTVRSSTQRVGNSRTSTGGTGRYERTNHTIGTIDRSLEREQTVTSTSLGEETAYVLVRYRVSTNDPEFGQSISIPNPQGWLLEECIGLYAPEGVVASGDADYDARFFPAMFAMPQDYAHLGGLHISDLRLDSIPYANIYADTENHIRVLSFIPRHFESIYNSFYRNAENNPFKIDGQVEYNKYIANTDGGAETYNFPRRFANWQDDAFTTALHTPQHGDAPLVGLVNQSSTLPYRVTFANDDGTNTTVHMGYDTQSGSVQIYHNDEDAARDGYVGQLEDALMEAVKFGITINDFRNVNSFQRWLENNVRKGYKYRDQIKAHYGVKVAFDVLDMPEYLGGTSRDMNVTQVTQTTENENGVLGDYAGQAWIEGESQHGITKYCDEDGYIIGILHIMPMASYSQMIQKHLLRDSAFDWFSPEFGKIGMQPILNRELAPIASFYRGNGKEVFGYNRPWYDLLDCVDTVHGKFRTEFRNFIINRVFDDVPTLSEDFLVFDPDQVNNVFYTDDEEDKILGQILFNYKVRIPVPLHGIAALE